MTDTYYMHIETAAGVKQHPWHLGTILDIAESFVFEHLRQPATMSIALYLGSKLVGIYDWRSLPEHDEEEA